MRQLVYTSDQLPRISRIPLDLIRDRDLLWVLVRRDLLLRYGHLALAAAWVILEPLLLSLVLLFVFTVIVDLRKLAGIDSRIDYYGVVLTGVVPWLWTASVLQRSTPALIEKAALIRNVCFARETVPLAVVFSTFCAYLLSGLMVFGYLTAFAAWPTEAYMALPLVILIHAGLLKGAALLLSLGHVYFRDLQSIVRVVVALGFFLSPIFYTAEMVRAAFDDSPIALGWAKPIYYSNPMVGLLEAYRDIMVRGQMPSADILIWPAVAALATIGMGLVVFRRQSATLADVV